MLSLPSCKGVCGEKKVDIFYAVFAIQMTTSFCDKGGCPRLHLDLTQLYVTAYYTVN